MQHLGKLFWAIALVFTLGGLACADQITPTGASSGSSISVPVSPANGGNGDTLGRLVAGDLTPNLKNNSGNGASWTNLLGRYSCSGQGIQLCTWKLLSTTDTYVGGVCDTTCDNNTTHTPVIATQGSHPVMFDGVTVPGDWAIISPTVAANAHDTGTACTYANMPSPSTSVVGCVQSVNAGAGTLANVALTMRQHQLPLYTSGKCQVASNTLCGTCSGAGCNTGANGVNGWTPLCTVVLGPWPYDPGITDTTVYVTQNIVDFTFAPNAGAGGAGSSASATNLEFRLATTTASNADNHGFPIGNGTSYNTTQQRYPNQTMVGLLNFGATDPLYPSSQTFDIDCQTRGPANSEAQVNQAAQDGNTIPNGTAFLVVATPFMD